VADKRQNKVRPLVSVVMPVRNGMPWVEHQLRALTAQRIAVDWEIVVADNGSEDGTILCVRRFCEQYPRVRLIDASTRRGPGAARNAGVRLAQGGVLIFCDADDVVRPGWLDSMSAALTDADLVAGVFDFTVLDNGSPMAVPVPAGTSQLGFLPFALGANMALSREAFDAVEGFNEELSVGEDVDLSWRLQLAGYRFSVAADAIVDKRERSSSGPMFRAAWAYGKCGPRLYRRFRIEGMRRDLRGAVKAWLWLVIACPGLLRAPRRRQWVRTFGIRLGSLAGSIQYRAFFP
jgi:GT2 family glycosyltransferase